MSETEGTENKDVYSQELTQREYEDLRAGKTLEEPAQEVEEKEEGEIESTEEEQVEEKDDSEEQEDAEDDLEDSEDESEEDEDEEKGKATKKRKSGWQKRRERYSRRLQEKDDAIAARERRIQELEELVKDGKPEKVDEKPIRPVEEDFEYAEDFDKALDSYTDDLADWKVREKQREQVREKSVNEGHENYQKAVKDHSERVAEFKKETPDFDEVLKEALEGVNIKPELELAVLDSDISEKLIYELAKDPDEFERINSLPMRKMERAIGRYEAKILDKSSGEKPKKVKKTQAPPPLGKTVGTKGKGTAKGIYDAHSMSQREWERRREEQLKKRKTY